MIHACWQAFDWCCRDNMQKLTCGRVARAGAFVAVMTVFAAVCMAETRGVPLEAMRELWRAHCFWRGALALTGAGGESPHRVSDPGAPALGAYGGVPEKGWNGGQDGTNGSSSVKRPLAQTRVNGASGMPVSREADGGQATADKGFPGGACTSEK